MITKVHLRNVEVQVGSTGPELVVKLPELDVEFKGRAGLALRIIGMIARDKL